MDKPFSDQYKTGQTKGAMPMFSQEEIQQQQDLLTRHRQRLSQLLQQQADYGVATPPYIISDIREARHSIQQIKAVLRQADIPVADGFQDEEQIRGEDSSDNSTPSQASSVNITQTAHGEKATVIGQVHGPLTINQ
jgi:hypothetical protein